LSKKDARTRAAALLDKISNSQNWRGETRQKTSWEVTRATDTLASILRQARAASTSIAKLEDEFKDILEPVEVDALRQGRVVIHALAEAAQLAKEQGKRLAKKREAHEKAIAEAANIAFKSAFVDVLNDIASRILFCGAFAKGDWHFEKIVSGDAFQKSTFLAGRRQDILDEYLAEAIKLARSVACTRIRACMISIADAENCARKLRSEFDQSLLLLHDRYDPLISQVLAELVARRIEQSL